MDRPFDALTIDVGGVLVVPHHDTLEAAFREAGLAPDRSRFWDGHYAAMHAVDANESSPESFGDYLPAFCHFIGFVEDGPDEVHQRAVAALAPLFGPSRLWSEPIEGSVSGLAAIAAAGIPRLILSNADGTIAEHLLEQQICQVGPGPGVEVDHLLDSGAFGHAKPDRRIFDEAVQLLGTEPERTLHIGDSVLYDVDGARAAGLQALHFDPRGLCERSDHGHLASLNAVL